MLHRSLEWISAKFKSCNALARGPVRHTSEKPQEGARTIASATAGNGGRGMSLAAEDFRPTFVRPAGSPNTSSTLARNAEPCAVTTIM